MTESKIIIMTIIKKSILIFSYTNQPMSYLIKIDMALVINANI